MTTERPILFSGALVRAILDGRKTETRRPVKPQPEFFEPDTAWLQGDGHSGVGWYAHSTEYPDEGSQFFRCPYGTPGDLLWVRETWHTAKAVDHMSPTAIGKQAIEAGYTHEWAPIWYAVDGEYNHATVLAWDPQVWNGKGKKRPAVHMPKWAARIWLRVEEVRVERLLDITDDGARAEGVEPSESEAASRCFGGPHRWAFLRTWSSIYGEPGSGPLARDTNPWVWVVRFSVVSTTGGPS